ncbi:MAG: hypothetical protein A3F67_01170 [Verrucomicrobia bacterium RIFCSPHIGHO2_12_FULL_41_10]|nr:MAG: hypothetical protein A3F67_01170 [Verrucomicrobia bacterium RIFCSPHIGHO2_12_FULL_41_10]
MYLKRATQVSFNRYLQSFPVVGVTGPRQSGKSTLLQHALPHYTYITFDEEFNIATFEDDPQAFIQQHNNQVIFDEVQFVPKLFHMIKAAVDKDRQNYGRFVLTGSSQFSFLQKISESLAGRIGLLTQLPLQYSEMPKALLQASVYQGGYPELVLRDYQNADLWYSSYFDTYLMKDVRTLMQIGDIRDFRRLIQLLATQVSQTLDLSFYAKNIGVSVPTIKRWLSVLEASYIIFLLPPYYKNFGKRITKSPKIYFVDTGLISYLTGIQDDDLYNKGPMAGPIFENYVVSEIFKKLKSSAINAELFYFRTQDKAEIDLIVDYKQHADFIEIKKSSTYTPRMASALKSYATKPDRKLVLYQGETLQHHEIEVLNYADYLQEGVII